MASIDQVIARSRQAGEFTERKRFTVERSSAIRKMRKFALANPYFYILELIQAAIANHGSYIDIQVKPKDVVMSYVGGGFTSDQLAQIFDFLFASKDNIDIADIRQLALGINALMLSEPDEIVLESGKGTLETTTRVVIDGKSNTVDVGTPTEALDGTYVRASGLNRNKLGRGTELDVIESRCLTSPVPILFNHEPIFGYSSMRTPNIMGYKSAISFDEGDLYGTIGLATTENTNSFKLLTYGVWVQSMKHQVLDGHRIGGIICFDRLRKTADHAGIVHDNVLEELWARIRPYCRELVSGKKGRAHFNIKLLDGTPMNAVQIREKASEHGRIVAVRGTDLEGDKLSLAAQFGQVFDAPVFVADGDEMRTLELVATEFAEIIRPLLREDELEFYRQPEAADPPQPWIAAEVAMKPETLGTVIDQMSDTIPAELLNNLPRRAKVSGRVFTPTEDQNPGALTVDVRAVGRSVGTFALPSDFPGHVLVVDVADVSPMALVSNSKPAHDRSDTVAERIARVVAVLAEPALQAASKSVLDIATHRRFEPTSSASRILLAAVGRGVMKSIYLDSPRVGLKAVAGTSYSALTHRVFETLDNDWVSITTIAYNMKDHFGLVYGVVDGVEPDLEGLETRRILRLDAQQEAELIKIFGEAAYVRVDERDVLASHDGFVVRDMALGIREYGDCPLLVENADGIQQTDVDALVAQLMQVFQGTAPGVDEEARRQAARHLIWYVVHAEAQFHNGVEHLNLFVLDDGSVTTWDKLQKAFGGKKLRMLDGWATDASGLGALVHSDSAEVWADTSLGMNTFLFFTLADIDMVKPALEAVAEGNQREEKYYDSTWFKWNEIAGTVGLTIDAEYPLVAVVEERERRVWSLYGPGRMMGLAGRLNTERSFHPDELPELERALLQAGSRLLIETFEKAAAGDEETARFLPVALDFAGHHISLSCDSAGQIRVSITSEEARVILARPMWPSRHGGWLPAIQLVYAFAAANRRDPNSVGWDQLLTEDAPEWMVKWCQTYLNPSRVARPATKSKVVEPVEIDAAPDKVSVSLSQWLTTELSRLRPDQDGAPVEIRVVPPNGEEVEWQGYAVRIPRRDWSALRMSTDGTKGLLLIADYNWLVEDALREPDTDAKVWLLLACYALINERLFPVTNDHELAFQERVIREFA